MANESKVIWASGIAHITDGAQITDTNMSVSGDVDTALSSSNLLDYRLADITLTVTFGAAPTAGNVIDLYRRDINIVSTNDEPAPSTTYKSHYVGSFIISADTTQYLQLQDVPLAKECEFYIHNRSGQTINNTWDLVVIPKTTGT